MVADINTTSNKLNLNLEQAARFESLKPASLPVADTAGVDSEIELPVPEVGPSEELSVQNNVENLREAIRRVSEYTQNLQRNLQFRVDEITGRQVVTVVDSETNEVIRQIPSKEMLELSHKLDQMRNEGVTNVFVRTEV